MPSALLHVSIPGKFALLTVAAAVAACSGNAADATSTAGGEALSAPVADSNASPANHPSGRYADFFISSQGSNQVMFFDETNGSLLKVAREVLKPAASQIGFGGDLFLAAAGSGEVLRFDGFTADYKDVFIPAGEGGLTQPSAPNFGPDDLVYVGDTVTNQELRYDAQGHFIDVVADHSSGLTYPLMQVFDDTSIYIASRDTDSILRYDLKTKQFMGAFVPSGAGGLSKPVGLDFGPDGNLYASSSGTNAVLRYERNTGAFMGAFVPPNTAGLSDPRAVRFGGPNSNLWVVSSGNNQVLEFDRITGAFIRIVTDGTSLGVAASRGLTFTPRPLFHVFSRVVAQPSRGRNDEFMRIAIDPRLKDYSDRSPRVRLISISSSDPSLDLKRAVRGANFGTEDYEFELSACNQTGAQQRYRVEYSATNSHQLSVIASTEVIVPPQQSGTVRGSHCP